MQVREAEGRNSKRFDDSAAKPLGAHWGSLELGDLVRQKLGYFLCGWKIRAAARWPGRGSLRCLLVGTSHRGSPRLTSERKRCAVIGRLLGGIDGLPLSDEDGKVARRMDGCMTRGLVRVTGVYSQGHAGLSTTD